MLHDTNFTSIFEAEYQFTELRKMYTLTLQIESPSILKSLKKVCKAMDGVKVLKSSKATAAEDVPNATTIKAINDVRSGKTFKASSTDDLFQQILG